MALFGIFLGVLTNPTTKGTCSIIGALVASCSIVGSVAPRYDDKKAKEDHKQVEAKVASKKVKGATNLWLSSVPEKRATEVWFLRYAVFWISCFVAIIGLELYIWFDSWHYMGLGIGLTSPLLLQPLLAPWVTGDDPKVTPVWERHSVKANTWIAIYSFIGNYFYTHYFYVVLKAEYTMPSVDVNGVPIPMFLCTHFYFSLYHTLAACVLRRIERYFSPSPLRTVLYWLVVITMGYVTGVMETVTISGFPCYQFDDFHVAVTFGSALYGLYFVVSYPVYKRIDENEARPRRARTPFSTVVAEALATGMVVLCCLDFIRVGLGLEMVYKLHRPCKLDATRTCPPFKKLC